MNNSDFTSILILLFTILAITVIFIWIVSWILDKRSRRPTVIDTVEHYIEKLLEMPVPEYTYAWSNGPYFKGDDLSRKGSVSDVKNTKIITQATEDKYLIEIDRVLAGLIGRRDWLLNRDDKRNLKNARERCFQKPGVIEKEYVFNYATIVNRFLYSNHLNIFFSDLLEDCFGVTDENRAKAEKYISHYNRYVGNIIDGPDGKGLRVKCKKLYDYCEMYIFERELFSREKPTSDYFEVVKDHSVYIENKKEQLKEFIFRFSRCEETIKADNYSEWKQDDLYIAIMCNKRQLERHELVNNPKKVNDIINPPPPPRPRDPHDEYMDWLNGFTGIQSP